MKKLLFAVGLLISLFASAQPERTNRYYTRNRIWTNMTDSILGTPNDTMKVYGGYRSFQWITRKELPNGVNTGYHWNVLRARWEPDLSFASNQFFFDTTCNCWRIDSAAITQVNVINNIITDSSVTNVTILNDTTLMICVGSNVCDTVHINNTVNNINTVEFLNDSTVVVCNVDTLTLITQCDTVTVGRQPLLYFFQNGLTYLASNIIEIGGDFLHNTKIEGHNYTFSIPQANINFGRNTRGFYWDWNNQRLFLDQDGLGVYTPYVQSWTEPFIDMKIQSNSINGSYISFDDQTKPLPLTTYNTTLVKYYPNTAISLNTNDLRLVVNSVEPAPFTFGALRDTLMAYRFLPSPITGVGMIYSFWADTGEFRLGRSYRNTRNDGPTPKALYTDADGYVKLGPISGNSTITIINDTTILICSNGTNLCDTFITNVVTHIQRVTILDSTHLEVCDSLNVCDTLTIPTPTFFDRGYFDPNQTSVGNTYHHTNNFNFGVGEGLTISPTGNGNFVWGLNNTVSGVRNYVFVNGNTVSGSENFVPGRNMAVAGNTNFVAATDGQVFSTANYSATFGDAPLNKGIAALTGGFGNSNFAENGFTMGNNNVNGGSAPTIGTANQYHSSTVFGEQNVSIGSGNVVGGSFLFSNNTSGSVILFGKGISSGSRLAATVASSFNVGFGKTVADFEITSSKVRINDSRFEEYKGTNTAAANDLTLPLNGNLFTISGSTQINAITTADWQAGSKVEFIFTGTPTLKHNTAGGAGTAPLFLAGSIDFTAAPNDAILFAYDGTSWHEIGRKLASTGGAGVTADNGLIISSLNNVQLGSPVVGGAPLLHNSYITSTTSTFRLNLNGVTTAVDDGLLDVTTTGSGGTAIRGTTLTGRAVYGIVNGNGGVGVYALDNGGTTSGISLLASSTEGQAIWARSYNYIPVTFTAQPTSTNTVTTVAEIVRASTGVGANGIGGSIDFRTRTTQSLEKLSSQIISKWTNATDAARSSQYEVWGVNNAVTEQYQTIIAGGQHQLNKYGVGTFTGSASYLIAEDATGKLIEYPPGGLTGGNLITADNGLTANTATNVQLGSTSAPGSPLLHDSYIDATSAFTLFITGARTGSNRTVDIANTSSGIALKAAASGAGQGVYGSSSSGSGVFGISTSGEGGNFQSSSNYGVTAFTLGTTPAGLIQATPASTNTVTEVLRVSRSSQGTAGNGIGGYVSWWAKNSDGQEHEAVTLSGKWVDATVGTRTSQADLSAVSNAVTNVIMSAHGSGVVGIGISSGYTATRLNVVDNSLAGASMVDLTSTSTAATGSIQKMLNISLSGTNANSNQNTYGIYCANTHVSGGGSTTAFAIYGTSVGSGLGYGVYGVSDYRGVRGTSTNASGIGVYGDASGSSGGIGGWFLGTNGAIGCQTNAVDNVSLASIRIPASTNSEIAVANFERQTSGTAANGIGGSIDLYLQNSAGATVPSNQIAWVYTDVTAGSTDSKLILRGYTNGSVGDWLTLASGGTLQLNQFGAGSLSTDGSGNVTATSDIRLKDIQGNYRTGIDAIMNINPIVYKWNDKSGFDRSGTYIGFSAQNIQSVLGENAIGRNSQGYLSIQDRALLATLVNAVKEQQVEITELQKQITELKLK